ncbi:F-box protein At3g07870-like [Papaver somniferum]|uniref:F-box protein At3g07870-like n=1 Tax=Papaver somniferum TaxID=3469 RepID=UPI000E6F591C|nr:F-box protein At3g07870-like [Papaver somniferum]
MLGTSEWKSSQTVPYNIPDKRQAGVFVNGAFHWFGEAREENSLKLIVSLDISNEKFDKLQLPIELVEKKHSSMIIDVLAWCLCVLVMTQDCFEVWVMQDYGVQESWVKRYIIGHASIMTNFNLRQMWSLLNGQILLGNHSQLVIYDPKHSTFKELKFSGNLRLFDAKTYVESLVSLNSGTYACTKKNMIGTSRKEACKEQERYEHH